MKAIFSHTMGGLIVKIMGYNHDHCRHLYIGPLVDVPDKYSKYKEHKLRKEYVFIYEELDSK